MAKDGKMSKLKSRLGIGAGWDAEYLEEEDGAAGAHVASHSDYAGEQAVRDAMSTNSNIKMNPSDSDNERRYSPDSPFASGASPSAVTKHVRKPDLKRVTEITGREVREPSDRRRYGNQPKISVDGSTNFKPREFSEAILIGNHLKEGKTITVDLSLVESAQKQRFIDFMAGLVYALDGHLARSSSQVYILTPR